ncbi:hypothetical protein [Arenimonas donghaensis]|uniref:Uncharacterized protein n=1 Tax=Arenimonas donghaensis DSM 18148 = HO3-R19 TaxID=1121014 RepID=A0A087MLQ3_9GAMM|nr:hypothetical protein [Arenimonas donghaensis]KFL37806.1 hypothetical protein N788_01140 [Arenimonas donghaensis DSM 18148 = HO3-R19]
MPCRIEWRPSRWLVGALCLLAGLAAASVLASGLPDALKPMLAGLVVLAGLARARREALRAPVSLVWQGDTLVVHDLAGGRHRLSSPRLREQGPLLRIQARTAQGRRWSRSWWPDTLAGPDRRRLRLAAAVSPRSGIHLPSMAA